MPFLHQASCVAIGGRAVLIEGMPGSGKSSLALHLIDRGAVLIGDDGVALCPHGGQLHASPPPNIAGKLEIRNVGLIDLPTTSAPVALIIQLDPDAPRYVEEAERTERAGILLPLIQLYPDSATLPLRSEWALSLHGLSLS
ncbi:serine kinase [Altericroceibacterium spongiae]|uniref:Serine kinase n=1 Tax=Altericroceibacterium spongiae TaxID=2320269 RepID=A0A420EN61_9SPHN|nr:HPr kinase/phosphatase C-terminal domain-containing protein [Altericroceibacterium spongiae]RKF22044.1 serine kinase [Altericroceibacterium spongiae]